MTVPVRIEAIDHMVLTVADIEATCDFYQTILCMEKVVFGAGRVALAFGAQKINLHPAGNEYEPKARNPVPGSADFCLITNTPIEDVARHLTSRGVDIIEGPVPKTGAVGALTSVYFRDPDGNLVEVSNYG
ncbi:MAG: VOC family protein [Rhodospirillales bacterium]|nr:VOC family protein [Alphaproteobacteria bacterium]MBL6948132.1 VOC family protein [Rhodospirillales bacterium]